jgi:hypothetical protein
MKWRDISLMEVEEALFQPDKIEHFSSGKVNAFRAIGTKLLRVSYVEEKHRIIVISVVDKNK